MNIDNNSPITEYIPSIDELNNYHFEKTKMIFESHPFPLTSLFILTQYKAILNQKISNLPSIVSNILNSHQIRYIFNGTKCKWKAFFYQKGILTHFRIRLFVDNLKNVIVELQFRNGQQLHFLNIVYDFFTSCIDENIIIQITGKRGIKEFEIPEVNLSPLSEKELDAEMFPLLEMIENESNNYRNDFSSTFYTFSTVIHNKNIKEIIKCLDTLDNDVQNCMVCILLQLIENKPEIVSKMVDNHVLQLLVPIASGKIFLFEKGEKKKLEQCYSQFEVQTNAFKLLSLISKNGQLLEVQKIISENKCLQNYFEKHSHICYDSELKKAIIELKNVLTIS
jgi:hypothetical protein